MDLYSTANVEAAVIQFYCNGGNQETNTWLTSAQMSPAAWSFSFELVCADKKPEVQFFGASTVALKVGRFWAEVPPDQYEALRQKLLDLLANYHGPHIVQTRLCVAVACLVIHSLPERWQNPVPDLIQMFQRAAQQQGSGVTSAALLFQLLTVIPEEFSTLAMPTTRRTHVRNELSASIRHVLPLIQQAMEQQQQQSPSFIGGGGCEIKVQAVKCLQAWVQFGVPMDEMNPLIDQLLACVANEELYDVVLDALSSLVSHPDTHKYVNLLKSLLGKILRFEPLLAQWTSEGSYDIANPLVCLFVTFGESHSRMLIDWATSSSEGREMVTRLLRVILAVSSLDAQYPVQEILSEMPFGFWYIFQDDVIACEPPQYQASIEIFAPVYQFLVDSLLRKSMYNLNESHWTPDQRESFRCYRTDIADTVMYCFNILRENLLSQLLKHLEDATSMNQKDPSLNWPYLEATLYMWSAVAESLAEEEGECPQLTQFLAKLPSLPYHDNVKVISSALDCIGGFSEWLCMHPSLLPHVTPIVTTALLNPDLSLCATMALKDMCRECAQGMKPLADNVLAACLSALRSNRLKHGECVRLMYSVGKMLALVPPNDVLSKLHPILGPYLTELEAVAEQIPSPQLKPKVEFLMKILTMLFQSMETCNIVSVSEDGNQNSKRGQTDASTTPLQPVVIALFPQIYPLLKNIAEKWISDADVVETLCALLKQCVATLLDDIRPYAKDIITLIMQCYETVPHSCTLDLAKNFFVLYAKEIVMRPLLQDLFKHLVTRTLKEITSSSNASDFADLIAAFFGIASQILKKAPEVITSTEGLDLTTLFNASIGCLGMPETGPVKYSAQFISNFINVSRDASPLNSIVAHQGEVLFHATIRCIGGESARSFIDYYVDVLFALNKKYFDNLRIWLNTMVHMDNFPTANVTAEQKQHFATLILKERANRRKLVEITREFSLACCGLAGTEYAVQMGQVMAAWDRIGMKQEAKVGGDTR